MDTFDLKQPDLYISRELSLLEFNRRVLAQASDPLIPLLERLRYMCITSTNIDGVAGTLTLDYAPDENGTADITARATDTGGEWVESTFTVTVNPVNDGPVATADEAAGFFVTEAGITLVTPDMLGQQINRLR